LAALGRTMCAPTEIFIRWRNEQTAYLNDKVGGLILFLPPFAKGGGPAGPEDFPRRDEDIGPYNQTARVTLPLRRQRVHTYTWRGEPSTIALTRLILGFQERFERRCE